MKTHLVISFTLAVLVTLTFAVLTATGAFGQATQRPRLPGTVVQPKVQPPATTPAAAPQVNPNAIGFPKKRLHVNLVDADYGYSGLYNGRPSYYGPSDVVMVFTTDDALSMSASVKPSFQVLYPEYSHARFASKPATVNPNNALDFFVDPKGPGALSGKNLRVEWIPEGQAVRITSSDTTGTFVLHADFIDAENKTWYFGKAVFRIRAEPSR